MKPHLAARLFVSAFVLVSAPAPAQELPGGLAPADWSSIHAAWEAGRHAAYPSGEGFGTRTPGQGWSTEFDRDGAMTTDDGGGWTWGLELVSWGVEGALVEVEQAAAVSADGGRVSLAWGERLTEWWINDTRGLEHGFTVCRRPEGGQPGGPIRFTLDVRGGLRPEVVAGRRSARFVDDAGATKLDYSGLVAFDARGLDLDAWMEVADGQLVLCVDVVGAEYPVTVDPVVQAAYLKASNTGAFDEFGVSVAVSGDTLVVGAWLEDSNATGVNGDQSNNGGNGSGAAYVFTRSGTTWSQQAYLKASNTGASDMFGGSVAVSGDTIVVGARGEGSNATGVNGDQLNNSAADAGAAYVFMRSGTSWSQQAYLKASNTDAGDSFGSSVAVFGERIVVGAYLEDSNATGVNGDQLNNGAGLAGAAYVFTRSGASWIQDAYLKASNSGPNDQFGTSVAVALNTVVVGAPLEASGATGVNGDQLDNSASFAGAAYVFTRNGTSWSQQAYLKASNTEGNDFFGRSVAIAGDLVVVGAFAEDSNATGVNGDESDNSAIISGAAYVFIRSGTSWSQQAYLKASNTGAQDEFGWSVAVSGDTVVAGGPNEESNATGVDGDQSNNSLLAAGAAYIFDLGVFGALGASYCAAAPNSTGSAGALQVSGSPWVLDNDVVLVATSLPPNQLGFFIVSRLQGLVMNPAGGQGNLCLAGAIGRYVGPGQIQSTGATGEFALAINLGQTPQPTGLVQVQPGETWNFQAWYRD